MITFDLSDVVAAAAALPPVPAAKLASITLSGRQRFLYAPLPEDMVAKWTALQDKIVPADGEKQEIDHITVCFCPKADTDIPQSDIDRLVKELRTVAADHPPILAKISGWSYFDSARKNDKTVTALVALVNAPGLDDVQGEMKSVLDRLGFKPSSDFSFTPHFTFAYLKHGERVSNLPLLTGEFPIDKLCLANRDIHELVLKGSLGAKIAKMITGNK